MFPRTAFLLPFAMQAALMLVDELHFHRRRGLPRWEVWGHPLDTLAALAALSVLLVAKPSATSVWVYLSLSMLSILLVTKDEAIHLAHCRAGEQRLHAMLFQLHPTVLIANAWLWWTGDCQPWLQTEAAMMFGFCLFQIAYWGIPWPFRISTIASTTPTETDGIPRRTIP